MRARTTALAGLLLACTGSADDADRVAVLDHLTAIAPLAIVPDSFAVIGAARTGDHVTFRTVWAFTDTSGTWVDTSGVLVARVADEGAGVRVAGYDGPLAAHIVELVDEDRRRRYEDLLDAVHHVYHAAVEAGWYYAPEGIQPAALRERVEAAGHAMHHPWGITAVDAGRAQVIWLADAANADAVCALPITDGELSAEGFAWVQDRQWFTCRGRMPALYSRAAIPDEVRDAMNGAGVLPAAPPGSSRGDAGHRHD